MKKRVLSLLLAVTMVLTMLPFSAAAEEATGNTVYVTSGGTAVGDGTEGNPYATLAAAMQDVTGKTTIVLSGSFTENVTVPMGSDITLQSKDAQSKATICGTITAGTGSADETTILSLRNLVLDGKSSKEWAIFSQNETTEKKGVVDLTMTGCEVQNYTRKGMYMTNARTVLIEGSTFKNNASTPPNSPHTYGDFTIDFNLVGVQDADITLRNNLFQNNQGRYAVVKVTKRGGASDADQPWGENAGTTVEQLTIENCGFIGNYTGPQGGSGEAQSADINIGSKSFDEGANITGAFPVTIANTYSEGEQNSTLRIKQAYKNNDQVALYLPYGNTAVQTDTGDLYISDAVDVTPAVRGNGPAAGVGENFDYQAAYKDAGVTWKSAANAFTYTVDEKTMKAFIADEANAEKVTALTNADHLYIGVVFPTPSVSSNIAKLSYTVNGGEAVEVDLKNGEDGPTLFKGQYINYFGLAGNDGSMLQDSTWTIAIDWKDNSDKVVAKSSVVVKRIVNEEQTTIPGGGGGSVTPDPEPTPEPDDSTVTTTTEVKPEINGSTAQAAVDSASMNQTVEDAIHAAAEQQKAPEVEVKVPVADGVDSVEVTLPQDSVAALSKAEDSVLTISSDVGVVSLDNTAVASVAQQAKEQITISVKPVASSELNDKQQETVGNAPVYDITIKSGNAVISSLGGGKASVKVPYTLKAGESGNGIVAYYLDDAGNIHICSSKYDAENEMVIFTTTHFSKYMVKYVAEMDWDNTFTDVDNGQWYYPAVGFVVENGLMNGYGDDTFGPSNKLKRSEFAQILYNAEGKPDISNEDLGYPFEDVAGDVWYADAVYWARLNGIVEGVTDTAFGPDKYITREQLAVMLYRYAEFKGYDLTKGDATLNDFTDKAAISAYAKTAMEWAVSVGVVNGKENKILDPKGTAKRAEVAQMLQNFYGVFEK